MKTITEIIKPITLLKGSHEDTGQTGQGCFMNVVAYLNGEAQITDQSECVCVTVRPIAIWLNDYLQDNERVRMIPFIERAMGSATKDKDEINRRLALVVTFTQKMSDISVTCAGYAAQSADQSADQSDWYAKSAARCAAEYAARCAAEYARYAKSAARYAAEYAAGYAARSADQSADQSAAECARYAAEYATESARYAARSAEIRQQIINAAFEYLDAALPKRECTNSAVLKRAEKLAEML